MKLSYFFPKHSFIFFVRLPKYLAVTWLFLVNPKASMSISRAYNQRSSYGISDIKAFFTVRHFFGSALDPPSFVSDPQQAEIHFPPKSQRYLSRLKTVEPQF